MFGNRKFPAPQCLIQVSSLVSSCRFPLLAYRRAGDGELSEAAWKRYLLSLSPKSQGAGTEVAMQLIDAELLRSNYGQARQMAEWSLNQLPDSAPLRLRSGVVLLAQGEYEQAEEAFEATLRAARALPSTSTEQGRSFEKLKRPSASTRCSLKSVRGELTTDIVWTRNSVHPI